MGQALSQHGPQQWGRRQVDEKNEEERIIRDLVEEKHWKRIIELLELAPLYASQRNSKTGLLPLHWALSKQAPLDVISCLLKIYSEGALENDNEDSQKKALHYAAFYYCKEVATNVLEMILDLAPEVAAIADVDGMLPLHLATKNRASKETILLLLKAYPDGASRKSKTTKLPIHIACECRCSFETTKELLEAFPEGVRESSAMRYPLHFACEFKASIEVIKELLTLYPEASFAKSGVDTMLPLHLAAGNKATPDIIDLLVQYNQDAVLDRDNNMRLPIHHALERNAPDDTVIFLLNVCPETASVQGYYPHLPLHIALEKNFSCAVIEAFLAALPSSSCKRDAYGILPLRRAIKTRAAPDVVLALLKDDVHKAAVNEMDEYERIALHYACARKFPLDVISALIDACPESAAIPDKNGQLPLHLSVMRSAEIEVVSLLIQRFPAGAIARDNYSYVPIHHAIEVGASDEIFELLIATDRRCTEMRVDGKLPLNFAIETKRSENVVTSILNAYPFGARESEHDKGRIALQQAIERRLQQPILDQLYAAYPGECSLVKDNEGKMIAHYCVEHEAPANILKQILEDNPSVVTLKELPFYYYSPTEDAAASKKKIARPTTRRPGKQLIHYATEDMHANARLVEEVLMVKNGGLAMPISATGEINLYHGYGWTYLISECDDKYCDAVERILDRYNGSNKFIQLLCDAPDELGRPAHQIASPKCRRILLSRLHYFARYEFLPGPIAHESENSIVKFAFDHGSIEGKRTVVLKFMKYRDQFDREINLRTRVKLSEEFVVPVLASHDSDADPRYSEETRAKGFSLYPYLVVTAAADRDLQCILLHERVAGHDYAQIRRAAREILRGLDHFHDLNLIHGDVKPMNVVRIGGKYKFIDLGSSVPFDSLAGVSKVSSAYIPPEMVFRSIPKFDHAHEDGGDHVNDALAPPQTVYDQSTPASYNLSSKTGLPIFPPKKKSVQEESLLDLLSIVETCEQIERIPAHYSIDMWSFGVLFYFCCTGESLFHCTTDDMIDSTQRSALAKWEDSVKFKKLSKVTNVLARNLILQLLSKHPSRRPTAAAALEHPFFTMNEIQNNVTDTPSSFRFEGMPPKYDVCICYRIVSERMQMLKRMANSSETEAECKEGTYHEAEYALEIEKFLNEAGLTTCYSEGGSGLYKSRACIVILSRAAINNDRDESCNFGSIHEDSTELDELFLDIRMAIELTHHGLLEGGVYSVLVGDRIQKEVPVHSIDDKEEDIDAPQTPTVPDTHIVPYYATMDGEMLGRWGGSHPSQVSDKPIELVEKRVCDLLKSFSLGVCPILTDERASVVAIMRNLLDKSICVEGSIEEAWRVASLELVGALNQKPEIRSRVPMDENVDSTDNLVASNETTVLLLTEKVKAKELEISLLNSQIEKDRMRLESKIKELGSLRYKYSIFD